MLRLQPSSTLFPYTTLFRSLEQDLRAAHARIGETTAERPSSYVRRWYAPQAARELLAFRALAGDYEHADVLRIVRSEEHTSELQSHSDLVCRLLLEKKKTLT